MPALIIDVKKSGLNLDDVYAVVRNKRALMAVLGREAANLVRANFVALQGKGNALGAPPAGFYDDARKGTQVSDVTESQAVVSINQAKFRGIRLQYLGGTVVPVNAKALTIPAGPEGYARRAAEIPGLFLLKKAGEPIGLAIKTDDAKGFKIVYWLRKSATIGAHPEVLPSPVALAEALRARATAYYNREALKKG